ncbi:hypothetical protein IV203_037688 [Nitzschia inconspicua]|uniref:Uncharacterized protein n=1 Tax=Nitzschia inconspicua TaxID=303405 RepID=A0A9K3LQ06_9STRA|nr:hypothetical protein IV203_037688 [Nitzschia inconspicua]
MATGSTSSTSSPTAGSKSSLSHDVTLSRPLISGRFDPNDFVSRFLPPNHNQPSELEADEMNSTVIDGLGVRHYHTHHNNQTYNIYVSGDLPTSVPAKEEDESFSTHNAEAPTNIKASFRKTKPLKTYAFPAKNTLVGRPNPIGSEQSVRSAVTQQSLMSELPSTSRGTVVHVLKRTRMIAIDCKPTFVDDFGTTFVEPGKSADTVHLMINNSREWTIKKTMLVQQKDGWNCGPIACMKLWTMFAPGEVDVCSLHPQEYNRVVVAKFNALVRTLMKEITWSAEENSERRKCELKKSSEQSVIVDTETRSGTKTAGSSIGEDGGRQPPKTETDVRNEARRVACIKRKRNQEIQAEKMVRLRNETLQHVTPGTVVSMKMDPRDVKRARGLLGIVCDRSGNRAGGVQVATEEGIVTADLKKREYFIPSDRYAVQKVQDLALPDKLEVVRQEIMNGLFDLGKQKQKVSMKTAYRLVERGPPIERKGCGCKGKKCTHFCGCVKAKKKCSLQ